MTMARQFSTVLVFDAEEGAWRPTDAPWLPSVTVDMDMNPSRVRFIFRTCVVILPPSSGKAKGSTPFVDRHSGPISGHLKHDGLRFLRCKTRTNGISTHKLGGLRSQTESGKTTPPEYRL